MDPKQGIRANQEINVVRDLIDNYIELFEVCHS